jgi:DNA-binding MurR/RpiR family transcriptional regulator
MPGVEAGERSEDVQGGEPDVAARIRARLPDLSPNDRLIADHLLRDPAAASYASAEALARAVGVSKAAVVRLGVRLGFGGYAGLQDALAADVQRRLQAGAALAPEPEPVGPARPQGHPLARWHSAIRADLEASVEATGSETLDRAAAILESGEGWIHVFGQRASAALAEYAYFLLNPLLPNVVRVESGESAIADHLLDIGPEDRLLAVTFRRYAQLTTEVVSYFADAGAPVVLLTDSTAAPAAARATETLVCANDSPAPFFTVATGVFMLEVLAATLLERNPQTAGRRLGDAERVWGRFGTYGSGA